MLETDCRDDPLLLTAHTQHLINTVALQFSEETVYTSHVTIDRYKGRVGVRNSVRHMYSDV